MADQNPWIWSQEHRKYYRQVYRDGNWDTIWQGGEEDRFPQRPDSGTYESYTGNHLPDRNATPTPGSRAQGSSFQTTPSYPDKRFPQHQYGDHTNTNRQSQYSPQYPNTTQNAASYPYSNPPIANQYSGFQVPQPQQPQQPPPDTPIQSPQSTGLGPVYLYRNQGFKRGADRGEGPPVRGEYGEIPTARHYEELDPSYFVRPRSFFEVGRMFSVLFIEPAGADTHPTPYNDSLTVVKYGELAYSQIRRFVVVRTRVEFCYACPVFTYGGRATLKPGVRPSEHAIVFTSGYNPLLLPGETGITKGPIAVEPVHSVEPLNSASRIYFGINHAIQYNVKVKDLGKVCQNDIPKLVGYWQQEHQDLLPGGSTALNAF